MLGQRTQIDDLGAREPDRAQLLGVGVEDLLRRRLAAAETRGQAAVDRLPQQGGRGVLSIRAGSTVLKLTGGGSGQIEGVV